MSVADLDGDVPDSLSTDILVNSPPPDYETIAKVRNFDVSLYLVSYSVPGNSN